MGAIRHEARAVGWWVLVGVGAGAIAGLLVGGVGGRLAMLLLRLTSPEYVVGLTSDDGFEIGVVTRDTLVLLSLTMIAGGLNGLAYAALRGWLPRRIRRPLWVVVTAAVVGATVVHGDGLDFTLLEPGILAIGLFVSLPAAAAALVVVLVERWADRRPFGDRRLSAVVVLAASCGVVALVPAAVVWGAAVVARSTGVGEVARPIARVAAPIAIVGVSVVAGADLVSDTVALI